MSYEYISRREQLELNALAAAQQTGHAAAMMTNLNALGHAKAKIWFEEVKVWQQRRNDFVAELPTGRKALLERVIEATIASYEANLITDLSKVQAKAPDPLEAVA